MDNDSAHLELGTVLNTLTDGVIMINGRGIIERYNRACEMIFGFSADEVIGKNIDCLMPEPYRREHDAYLTNYQKTGTPKIIGIGRRVSGKRKDGTNFPMYLSVGEIPNIKDRAYVGIIRDLTDDAKQRADFEQLQQAHFHLSRVSAMDQMGAAIAHELNQPLTAIMNFLSAGASLMNGDEAVDKTQITDIIEKSLGQAERAANILSRLRSFIETGDVEKNRVSVAHLIHTSLGLTMPQFNSQNININYEMEDDNLHVLASEVQIQQVLVNLIKNACEAMTHCERKELTITTKIKEAGFVTFGVMDKGSGLSENDLETLYEPFSSDKKGGLGVGLSISHSIIANHEGQLWAENNTHHGASFYFTLPTK